MTGPLAAVVVPQTPLLLPGTGGAAGAAVVDQVRDAALAAIGAVHELGPRRWVVVGGVPQRVRAQGGDTLPEDPTTAGDESAGTRAVVGAMAPWPGRDAGVDRLPLSLAVGSHLLAAAGVEGAPALQPVSGAAGTDECLALGRRWAESGTALLVVADGAARRTTASPGRFDERAEPFDDEIETALWDGVPETLVRLDPGLGEEVLCGGRPALQVLAGAFPARTPSAGPLLATAPLGVRYWVTTWR